MNATLKAFNNEIDLTEELILAYYELPYSYDRSQAIQRLKHRRSRLINAHNELVYLNMVRRQYHKDVARARNYIYNYC